MTFVKIGIHTYFQYPFDLQVTTTLFFSLKHFFCYYFVDSSVCCKGIHGTGVVLHWGTQIATFAMQIYSDSKYIHFFVIQFKQRRCIFSIVLVKSIVFLQRLHFAL